MLARLSLEVLLRRPSRSVRRPFRSHVAALQGPIEVPLELRAAPLKVLLRSLRPKFSILGVSLAPLTEGPLLSKILGFGDRTFLWEDPFNQNTIPI